MKLRVTGNDRPEEAFVFDSSEIQGTRLLMQRDLEKGWGDLVVEINNTGHWVAIYREDKANDNQSER